MRRRGLLLLRWLLILAIPLVALASLSVGLARGEPDPFEVEWKPADRNLFAGVWMLAPAALLALSNAHVVFLRPWLYRRRHGSMKGCGNVSPVPVFGDVFRYLALNIGWGATGTALLALATCLLDAGSLFWLILAPKDLFVDDRGSSSAS